MLEPLEVEDKIQLCHETTNMAKDKKVIPDPIVALDFYFNFFILEELYLMVHIFIIQILGFQEFFFSFS